MNIRARALVPLVLVMGTVDPALADPDPDGWVPRKPAARPAIVIRRVGNEVVGPPAYLPPVSVELPDMPPIPAPPEMLPSPGDVADPPVPPAPPMPETATVGPVDLTREQTPAVAAGGWMPWAEVEFLRWAYRGSVLPPLVTVGMPTDLIPGAVGQPTTRVLFGGGSTGTEWAGGLRVRLGGPLGPASPFGWQVGWFCTQPQVTQAAFVSGGPVVLARPFHDTLAARPGSFVFGVPGLVDGNVSARTRTTLWGFEAHATANLAGPVTGFAGFRYLEMTDEVSVLSQDRVGAIGSFINGTPLPAGSFEAQGDRFTVRNRFDGAQVGVRYGHGFGPVGFDLRAAVALGVTRQELTVQGGTQTVDPLGVARSAPAGFLALASNSGQFDRDRCTLIPELGARLTYRAAPGVQVFAGYDVLYWANVARAGDQIDPAQDPRQNPSSFNFTGARAARPAVWLRDTDFWAQGLSFGVRVEY